MLLLSGARGQAGHPWFARHYAARSIVEEPHQAAYRARLTAGLAGRVLEVGCGNGLNFPYFPAEVTELVGVEPEPYLRQQAEAASRGRRGTGPSDREGPGGGAHGVPGAGGSRVAVVAGTAETVGDLAAGSFDAVVFSLVLCTVPAPVAALRAAEKVLRPGGEVRVYEHVAGSGALALRQHLFAPLWALAAGGCRPDRDTLAAVAAVFEVEHVDRFELCVGCPWVHGLVAPRIMVRARKAAAG